MTADTQADSSFASVDGELRPLREAVVPVVDRGFLLGDAVFETLRTYQGRLFALEQHLDRLESSMGAIGLEGAPGRDRIAGWLREATRHSIKAQRSSAREGPGDGPGDGPECVVRVTVTRGDGPHGISTRGSGPPRVVVIARALPPVPAEVYTEGLRVITASVRRAPVGVQDPAIKATSALNLILARVEADRSGAHEALLTNEHGDYLEATAANLIVLNEGSFWTPKGGHGVLEGVTWGIVEKLLLEEGFKPRYGPVAPEILFGAREVLLTQTTREVLSVVHVDEHEIADGKPGPMAARLREGFKGQRSNYLGPE